MKRIKILDSCRGLAALIVVFHHVYTRFGYLYSIQSNPSLHTVLHFISDCNREAVLFFFMLSGFSIRLSLYKGMPLTKAFLNNYLFRRFNRIVPLYLISIAITTLAGFIINELSTPDFSLFNLFGNLLFLQNSTSYKGYWFSPYGGNGPFWSISFEMFYYLFFPLFIFSMNRIFKERVFANAAKIYILAIAFLISLVSIVLNKIFYFPYIAFATLFYVWFAGFFLADLYVEKKLAINNSFISILVITLFAYALHYAIQSDTLHMLFLGSSLSLGFYLLYFVRRRLPLGIVVRFESVFNFLFYQSGRGSYALYLLHYPILLVLLHYQIQSLWLVFGIMIISLVLCVFIEEYFVKKRFGVFKIAYLK